MFNPYLKISVTALKAALSSIPTPLASQTSNIGCYRLLVRDGDLTIMSYNLNASGSTYIPDVAATDMDIVISAALIKILLFGSKDLHLEIVGNQLVNKHNKNKIALINTEDWIDEIEVNGESIFVGDILPSLKSASLYANAEHTILNRVRISPADITATNGHLAYVANLETGVTDEVLLPINAIPYLNKQCDVVFGDDGNVKVITDNSDVVVFGSAPGDYPRVAQLFPSSFKFEAEVNTEKAAAILALIKSVDANSVVDVINVDGRLHIAFSNDVMEVLEDVGVDDIAGWGCITFSTKYLSQILTGVENKIIRQNTPTTPAIFESEGVKILGMPIIRR